MEELYEMILSGFSSSCLFSVIESTKFLFNKMSISREVILTLGRKCLQELSDE